MQSPRIALNLMMPPVRDRFPCDIKALGLRIWRERIAELLRGVNQGSTFVRKQNAAGIGERLRTFAQEEKNWFRG